MPGRRRAESIRIAPDDRSKRLKTEHKPVDHTACFAEGLFDDAWVKSLGERYKSSGPFLHVVVDKLLQNDLLSEVKGECLGELSFSEKETDIYKVHQTGDLASLSYLAEAQIALLPNLLKLRDALYSEEFRNFLRRVTGCGPLSGKKQDMSVNSYRKGCHLLNHDDVIGTRRVSYVLYMPTPEDQEWKTAWGGALELYPVKPGPDGIEEPEAIPSKSISPSWNQFAFFEVQPGHSFHSVEEVIVDEGDNQRQRLSISGWFHRAQEGEEGYEGETVEEKKSSLEQLSSSVTMFTPYAEPFDPVDSLKEEHMTFLSAFLNPIYLQSKVIKHLGSRFVDESSVELHNFLAEPIAKKLEDGLKAKDLADKLDFETRQGRVPPHSAGAESVKSEWAVQGPPHKARYCTLNLPRASSSKTNESQDPIAILSAAESTPAQIIQVLEQTLFPSPAFRAWLYIVAVLIAEKHHIKARRFRPGLDYTLATSDNTQSILDVVLGLTPSFDKPKEDKKSKGKERSARQDEDEEDENEGWEKGEWGGWECYMAPHEGDEDPAVYQSHSSKKDKAPEKNGTSDAHAEAHGSNGKTRSPDKHDGKDHEDADDDEEEEEDDDDGTLLTVYPGFNRLMLGLRDEGVLRFTKYVSAAAPGSVWDVCGEYEVVMTNDRGDEEGTSSEESDKK